jgi:hypothetical protein
LGRVAPQLEFVDLGEHGYAKVRRLSADEMRIEFVCIPRPVTRSGKTGRRPAQVSDLAHSCPAEKVAPAAKNISSRRRRWTGDLTETRVSFSRAKANRISEALCG